VTTAVLGFIRDKLADIMGASTSSSSKGWSPSVSKDTPRNMSRSGYDVTPLTKEEREEAAKGLPSMSKYVVLEHGTERPFTGKVIMDQLL
jgi:hypothetical protein